MRLKHVKPIIASAMLMVAGVSFANTVKLVNASPSESGILKLRYQLAYQKDFGQQTITGATKEITLNRGNTLNIDIPQKESFKLSGIVVTEANVNVHGKQEWKKIPEYRHRFANSRSCSMATDQHHPDGMLKFKLIYTPAGHGTLTAEQTGGDNG